MSKFFKKITLLLALLLIVTTVLIACSSSDEELVDIQLMEVTHSLFYTPQYVALTQGFFEEEGLNIELVDGKGADKVMASLISGEAGGYIPYTAYSATKEYIEENPEIIQKYTNAIYKGMIWVYENDTPTIAEAGELDKRADYEAIVTTEFAEEAMKNIE